MIGLLVAAARSATLPTDVGQLRAHILAQLQTTYATGRGSFKGRFDDWSFRPQTRAAARTPFILRLVHNLGVIQLAPTQFVRLRDESLRAVNTLYLDINLIRTFNIDDNDKSFFAEFYLSIHDDGKGASIDQLDFSNAYLDPKTNDRQLTIRVLNDGGKSTAYPDDIKVYQVSGRFAFAPDLANYPFDTQRFHIDLRPRRADLPFIIQPPPQTLRSQTVDADGWLPTEQYVGFDEDFVPTVDARSHDQSVVPFYKTTFVWQMTRQTTDYYLRVVVPLGFILIVAYMSIFIPRGHFEAIVTIQVTALLSAVALYLALPKIDADTATLSDRIFLFIYMAVSLMIGLSIVRISPFIAHRPRVQSALGIVHIVLIPIMAIPRRDIPGGTSAVGSNCQEGSSAVAPGSRGGSRGGAQWHRLAERSSLLPPFAPHFPSRLMQRRSGTGPAPCWPRKASRRRYANPSPIASSSPLRSVASASPTGRRRATSSAARPYSSSTATCPRSQTRRPSKNTCTRPRTASRSSCRSGLTSCTCATSISRDPACTARRAITRTA
jgi:hypothetical protein